MISLQLLHTWGPWVGALLSGLLPFLVFRREGQSARRKDRAELIQVAQEAASSVIEELRAEIERGNQDRAQLRGRLEEVEAELADLRREHTRMMADKDAKIALLEGDNRQLRAMLDSYRRLMEANGIDPPPLSQQFYLVPSGDDPNDLEATT